MRLKLLIFALLLISQSAFAQINKDGGNISSVVDAEIEAIDPVYFVLGTLSDYMGRFRYVDKESQVDRYYTFEKPMVDYLSEYIESELDIIVDTKYGKSNNCEMFSVKLSNSLNSFYGEDDKLLESQFETKHQVYSFLTGVYYRYGVKLDSSIYKIQMSNSPKHQNCYDFLKQIGCENILYQFKRNIPFQYILYFEATDELKVHLESIEMNRLILRNSFYSHIEAMMTDQISKENMKKQFQESFKSEIEKIKVAFSK